MRISVQSKARGGGWAVSSWQPRGPQACPKEAAERLLLRVRDDEAKSPGVRHRRGEFGIVDALHAALHNRMLDAQHVGDASLESHINGTQSRSARAISVITGGGSRSRWLAPSLAAQPSVRARSKPDRCGRTTPSAA